MKTHSRLIIVFTVCGLVMFFANPAYAYIDPGTGSMLVQAVIAVIAAASVFLGMFWSRVHAFLSRLFGKKQNEGEDGSDEN